MTTISTVAAYTGTVPNRTQSQTTFNTNVNDILTYIDNFAPDLNTSIGEMNTVAGEVNADAAAAAQDAQDAAASALAAASIAGVSPYSGSVTYNIGDAALGSNGHTYRCMANGVIGDNPVGSVTGNWLDITQGVRHVTNEAALGTGEAEGQLAVTADDRIYTWNIGTSKWIARNGNHYSTTPSFGNVTFPSGTHEIIAGQLNRYNGTSWEVAGITTLGHVQRPIITSSSTTNLGFEGPCGWNLYGIGWVNIPSTRTHVLTSLAASTWSYVYLDFSNFSSPGQISASNQIYDSTTVPTWSNTKGGYYSGDDLCIFIVRGTSASTYEEFDIAGDYVQFQQPIQDVANQAFSTSFVDVTLTIPTICTVAMINIFSYYVSAVATSFFRKNGNTGTGHQAGRTAQTVDGGQGQFNQVIASTDSTQKIEIKGTNTGSSYSLFTNGFFLPKGM